MGKDDSEETCVKQVVPPHNSHGSGFGTDEDLNESLELPSLLQNKSPSNEAILYSDLDQILSGLPRQVFISELMQKTNSDIYKLLLYRDYLADEARKFPECPKTRLVNRRNSAKSRKEFKLAEDCYILYAFIEGSQSSELYDLFLSQDNLNGSFIACAQPLRSTQKNPDEIRTKFEAPDVTALLVKLQSDVSQILQKREEDRVLLNDIRVDVSAIATNVRVINASVNGIRSTITSGTPLTSDKVEKVQSDLRSVSATLASLNKRICDMAVTNGISKTPASGSGSTEGSQREDDSSEGNAMTVLRHPPGRGKPLSNDERKKSYAQTVVSQTAGSGSANCSKSVLGLNQSDKQSSSIPAPKVNSCSTSGLNEQGHVTIDVTPTDSPRTGNVNQSGFVAVRRKRVSTFYLGNIDNSVTTSDIYKYLDEKGIKATAVRLIPNKYSVSARVNIPAESDSEVLGTNFWPENIVVRRWMSQVEWARERKRRVDSGDQMYNVRGYRQNGRFDQNDCDYNEHSENHSRPSYSRHDRRSYETFNDRRSQRHDWYNYSGEHRRPRWFDADDDDEENWD